jgi:hypothetical protein
MKLFAALSLALVLALSGTALADDDRSSKDGCTAACDKVFDEARRLPEPTPGSVRDYGNRVVDAGKECVSCAIKSTGAGESKQDSKGAGAAY